jgi:hypothetical protein
VDKIVQIVTDACTELVGSQFGAFFYNVVNDRGEMRTTSGFAHYPSKP